ncbi:MAG: glycosyltransferase [Bacteroidales bacterium]|jgi:glycosyltransferase involved in cell wall biosynthesis|nr:glycosyltransferase [Bacteroidales bacterium]
MPAITILMPVYNASAFLRETMDSILHQTFTDFELLALDDGSTDGSAEIIQSYSDDRIQYILCPHDFISTLNCGLETARGKYIARMDHDDVMMPERLKVQYEYMEQHPETAACGSAIRMFGSQRGDIICESEHDDIVNLMIKHNPIANPSVMIRRDVLMEHNIRYRREYIFADDFKMWAEMAQAGLRLHNLPQVLLRYRRSSVQATSKYYALQQSNATVIQYEMLNYLLSCIVVDCEEKAELDGFLKKLEEFNEQSFFSKNVYFDFMYEFIRGLRLKGCIALKNVTS